MGKMVRPLLIIKNKPYFTHYTAGGPGCWHVYAWDYQYNFSTKIASFSCGICDFGIDAENEAIKLCTRLNAEYRKEQE